jgi:hypothetical protein
VSKSPEITQVNLPNDENSSKRSLLHSRLQSGVDDRSRSLLILGPLVKLGKGVKNVLLQPADLNHQRLLLRLVKVGLQRRNNVLGVVLDGMVELAQGDFTVLEGDGTAGFPGLDEARVDSRDVGDGGSSVGGEFRHVGCGLESRGWISAESEELKYEGKRVDIEVRRLA